MNFILSGEQPLWSSDTGAAVAGT
ncbi:hypothetical protein A2U01_0097025, partial [Trifolium medium]|nr:hypothetical protein [Trifolium medium]